MPNTRLARSRSAAFTAQKGLCYYCLHPIWLEDPDGFRAKYNLTRNETRLRQCTAEHLQARQDGGGDGVDNVAAACLTCNHGRHGRKVPLQPEHFRRYVQARVRKGRWHQRRLLQALTSQSGRCNGATKRQQGS